jgi:hypothetical protein
VKKILYSITLFLLVACGEESVDPTLKKQIDVKDKPVNTTIYCSIDTPEKGKLMPVTQGFVVSGWAFDERSETSPESIALQFIGTDGQVFKSFDAKRGTKRPDVVKAFKQPGAEMSGFGVVIPANSLLPGKYKITLLQTMPEYMVTCTKDVIYEVIEAVTPITAPPAIVVAPVNKAAKLKTALPNTMPATKKKAKKLESQQIVLPTE